MQSPPKFDDIAGILVFTLIISIPAALLFYFLKIDSFGFMTYPVIPCIAFLTSYGWAKICERHYWREIGAMRASGLTESAIERILGHRIQDG